MNNKYFEDIVNVPCFYEEMKFCDNSIMRLVYRFTEYFEKYFDQHPHLRNGHKMHTIFYPKNNKHLLVPPMDIAKIANLFINSNIFDTGFNVVACHDDTKVSHIHWYHICPKKECVCLPLIRARKYGHTAKIKECPRDKSAEHHFSFEIAYLCRFKRRILEITHDGKRIEFPDDLLVSLQSYLLRDNSDEPLYARTKRCSKSLYETIESVNKRQKVDGDCKRLTIEPIAFKNALTSADINRMSKSIEEIILNYFPYCIEDLKRLKEFNQLTGQITQHYMKINEVINKCWRKIVNEWQCKKLKDCIEKRKNSYFDLNKYYSIETSVKLVKHLVQEQFNNDESACKAFIESIVNCIDMTDTEKNIIFFRGKSDCGKITFIKSITNLVWSFKYFNKSINFLETRLIFALKGRSNFSKVETNMLENLFKGKINCSEDGLILPKMPIIITGNVPFDEIISRASNKKLFLNRCYQYNWTSQPWLSFCTKEIHPLVWKRLMTAYLPDDDLFSTTIDIDSLRATLKREHLDFSLSHLAAKMMISQLKPR